MRVFSIGNGEVNLINEALESFEESYENRLKDELDDEERSGVEYELAHIRTTRTLMKGYHLQELCERCLSYFWDRLVNEGVDNPDVEYLADDMGISEEELKSLFLEAGYEEDYDEEE